MRVRAAPPRRAVLAGLALAFGLAGCAGRWLWDGVIHVELPAVENPTTGPLLHILSVRDLREFRSSPHNPWRPSVYRGDPEDTALTTRIVGRRASSRRIARGGNILLSEGESAASLVRDAVAGGLRQLGWRIVEIGEPPGAHGASPSDPYRAVAEASVNSPGTGTVEVVDVEVLELWTRYWTTRNGLARFETRTRIFVRGSLDPLRQGRWLCGNALTSAGGPSRAVWERVLGSALENLASNLRAILGDGSGGALGFSCTPELRRRALDG